MDQRNVSGNQVCPECDSNALYWYMSVRNDGSAVDGRLRLNEVSPILIQACEVCSETIQVISDDAEVSCLIVTPQNESPAQRSESEPDGYVEKEQLDRVLSESARTEAVLKAEIERLSQDLRTAHAFKDPEGNEPVWYWQNDQYDRVETLGNEVTVVIRADHFRSLIDEDKFQSRVDPWLLECFGEKVARDKAQRVHRFIEECLELAQSLGCTEQEAEALVKYVFGRPAGDPPQEVGGVMLTLGALCLAIKINMYDAGNRELSRVWSKIPQIRAKQATKPDISPLPGVYPDSDSNKSEQERGQ